MIYRQVISSKEELAERIANWKGRGYEVTQFYSNCDKYPCMLCYSRMEVDDDKTFIDYFLVCPEDIK